MGLVHVRVQLRGHLADGARRVDPGTLPPGVGSRRRDVVGRFPIQQRSVVRVLIEQIAEQRGAGPKEADNDDRRLDLFRAYLGVGIAPVDDFQPAFEIFGDEGAHRHLTERVELRFRRRRSAIRLEPRPELR
jgi:hypothetical protein